MAEKKHKPPAQQAASGDMSWGTLWANCLWTLTFLMIVGFFWQSINAMLAG